MTQMLEHTDLQLNELLRTIEPRRWRITEDSDPTLALSNKKALDKIANNDEIQHFIHDDVRFKIVPVSRRSFKTELAKRIIIDKCLNNWDKNYFYGLPTYGQAKKTVWQDFKNMFPQFMINYIAESELKIYLKNGTELSIIGFDQPQRFEGKLWHGGVLDEFADFKDGIWEYHVLPALSDTNGWCIMIGTPEGIGNDFYRLYEKVLRSPEKYTDYKVYHWTRQDVSDQEIVDYYRSIMDDRAFRQEFLGEFVELSGRIYRPYNVDVHEDKLCKYKVFLDYPISICLDFNKSCCYELSQTQDNDFEYVFDEIYLHDTDITEMNNEIKSRLIQLCNHNEIRAKNIRLIFYGDYTSEARRDVSVPKLTGSAWKQIELEFENNGWNFEKRVKVNPHVMDRINAVNYKLSQNKLIHSTKCQELKKDFLNIQYGSDTDKERTHATDALGYKIHREFPLSYY